MFRKIIRKLRRGDKGSQPLPRDFDWEDTKNEQWEELRDGLRIPFNLNVMLEGLQVKKQSGKHLEQIGEHDPTSNPKKTL